MKIIVNGDTIVLDDAITIEALVNQLAITEKIAVELNEEIVPRSQFAQTILGPDDQIEIVRAIGGGWNK